MIVFSDAILVYLSHGADNLLKFLIGLINKLVHILLQLPNFEAIQLLLSGFDLSVKSEVLLLSIGNETIVCEEQEYREILTYHFMLTKLSFKLFEFCVLGLTTSLFNILTSETDTLLFMLIKHILHFFIKLVVHIHMQILS